MKVDCAMTLKYTIPGAIEAYVQKPGRLSCRSIGDGIVLQFCFTLPNRNNSLIFADNFFLSPHLVNELSSSVTCFIGTVWENSVKQIFSTRSRWNEREGVPLIFVFPLGTLRTSHSSNDMRIKAWSCFQTALQWDHYNGAKVWQENQKCIPRLNSLL